MTLKIELNLKSFAEEKPSFNTSVLLWWDNIPPRVGIYKENRISQGVNMYEGFICYFSGEPLINPDKWCYY